ncbi:MAG: hypothetical protein ACRDJH_14390 [Thermomicrobiales bacterium]
MTHNDEREESGPRHMTEPAESRAGLAKFFGLSMRIWAIVVVLAVVFLVVILISVL